MNEKEGVKRGYLYEDFRLFHPTDERGADTELHYHEFEKVLLVIRGNGSYTIEGRRYPLGPGDVVLVRDHAAHSTAFPAGSLYERIIFYVSREFLEKAGSVSTDLITVFTAPGSPVLRPGRERTEALLQRALLCERELNSTAFGSDLLARQALIRLLIELGRLRAENCGADPQPYPVRDSKILDILRYLDGHLTEDVSVDDLAARFYISKFHMMRRFKEEVGLSVHQYLSGKRLQLAREQIKTGTPAGDACFACGFRSYSAFARAYVKYFGNTPGEKENPAALVGYISLD